MIETIKRITTADTQQTYELGNGEVPQLWEVRLSIACISDAGTNYGHSEKACIHLERETLENAGLLPRSDSGPKNAPSQDETAEDLAIRLLEHLGYYPCEHEG